MSLDGSARAALLTVLGDVVRLPGDPAWLGALSELVEALGIPAATTRQALRRLTQQGLVAATKVGRRSTYNLTPVGRQRLDDAAERIYRRTPPSWDGRWRLLTWTFGEQNRSSRDALRRELGWLGYGSLGTSSYCCPWDPGDRLRNALAKHGVHGSVDTFTAKLDGDDRDLAARAYDMPALGELHRAFLNRFDSWTCEPIPTDPVQALARRVELVHEWRRTLFLDPGLPAELTPIGWLGDDAVALFGQLYDALDARATAGWRTLIERHAPVDV